MSKYSFSIDGTQLFGSETFELWVRASDGNDSNPGTSAAPLATLSVPANGFSVDNGTTPQNISGITSGSIYSDANHGKVFHKNWG